MPSPIGLELVLLLPWAILGLGLVLTKRGWTYIRSDGSKAAVAEAMAVRDMGLAFTGLVFAGLAFTLGTDGTMTAARATAIELLTVALAGAVIAWTLSNLAPAAGAAIVAETGILASLGGVLLAVAQILADHQQVRTPMVLSIGVAYTIVLAYSMYLALVHASGAGLLVKIPRRAKAADAGRASVGESPRDPRTRRRRDS